MLTSISPSYYLNISAFIHGYFFKDSFVKEKNKYIYLLDFLKGLGRRKKKKEVYINSLRNSSILVCVKKIK